MIGCNHLQHGLDPLVADLLSRRPHVFGITLESEAGLDQFFPMFHQKLPDGFVAHGSDLDELGKPVSDL